MYKNGFAMCVMHNGKILKETDRRVTIPFDSHYQVRLINKNSKRCSCDLFINGEKVERFRIDRFKSMDIERFIDGNNDMGRKFRFISLKSNDVKDKNDIDNGLIEAHFYLESNESHIREIHHYHYDHIIREDSYIPPYIPPYKYPYTDLIPLSPMYNTDNSGAVNLSFSSYNTSNLGATVRGNQSNQKFMNVDDMELENTSVILKLKLFGGDIELIRQYCAGCGRKSRQGDKYCGNCGIKY